LSRSSFSTKPNTLANIDSSTRTMAAKYNRKDHYYEQAKTSGYRSRAAFKLKELNQKFSLLKQGYSVADLGAWPGGWMQVAGSLVGEMGLVVGVDLVPIEPFPHDNIRCLTGDLRDEETLHQLKEVAKNFRQESRYDLVLSDMSAKLTGIKEADQASACVCAELALWVAQRILKPKGTLVMKVFKGGEIDSFIRDSRPVFDKLSRVELDSTRKTSNEFYLVASGIKTEHCVF